MTTSDIVRYRLTNQQIAVTKFKKPHEIVSWLVAMQAQEFAMAKWAIGLRLPDDKIGLPVLNDTDVEEAFNHGTILRTHLMRPTWHFITPADIRWMLALTAPRVNAVNAYMYRQLELDNKIFKRSNDTLVKTLQGGKQYNRSVLKAALKRAKIDAAGFRLAYLLMRAELDGIICSGAREGKQFTYALLDERVPSVKTLDRDEALVELTMRYFSSRGPATLQDFVWWSGLTMKDAKEGIAMLKSQPGSRTSFVHKMIDGREYIFKSGVLKNKSINLNTNPRTTFLMPDYDEYGISYKDRRALLSPSYRKGMITPYSHMIVIDGVIEGTWQRTIKNKKIVVETTFFNSLNKSKQQSVLKAVKRYTSFMGQ